MRIIFMCWFISLSFTATIAFSQDVEVKNVIAAQNFNDIIVTYDLQAENESQNFSVSLYCSTNGGIVFGDPLRNARGDVGFNISPGEGKTITWNVLEEHHQFVYDDVVFKVRAIANSSDIIDLVLIEGGSFIMGNENGEEDEKPAHEVQLSNFYISRYEVTVEQYKEYCEKAGKSMPEFNIQWQNKHPITYVSWEDAKAYCRWLSETTGETYRLPTEAEWEYVAKGGMHGLPDIDQTRNEIDNYAWHRGNTGGYGHYEVGRLKPNVLGIYDILGNVWEWCEDWYGKTYYTYSPGYDPKGPPEPPGRKVKVSRGGSWKNTAENNTETYRFYQSLTVRTNYVGFRVVKEP